MQKERLTNYLNQASGALEQRLSERLINRRASSPYENNKIQQNYGNLCKGDLGLLFLLLELHRHCPKKKSEEVLSDAVLELEEFIQKVHTNNFSLYCGRLGVAYFYIHLSRALNLPVLIEKAERITSRYFFDKLAYLKLFDNQSMLDGNASKILFCIRLYEETGQGWIIEIISSYLTSLLYNAEFNENGIYWHGIANWGRKHFGWSYGNSGLLITFSELYYLFGSEQLKVIAQYILRFEAYLGPTSNSGPFDCRAFLTELSRLHFGVVQQDIDLLQRWNYYAIFFEESLNSGSCELPARGLESGLAGAGLAFLDAYALTLNEQYLNVAIAIQNSILAYHIHPNSKFDTELFKGECSIAYFLVRLQSPEEGSLLFVLNPAKIREAKVGKLFSGSAQLKEPAIDLFQIYLNKNFKETITILSNPSNPQSEHPCASNLGVSITEPEMFLSALNEWVDKSPILKVKEAFEREKFVLDIKESFPRFDAAPESGLIDTFKVLLSISTKDFFNLILKRSQQVWVLNREGTFDYAKPITRELLHRLFNSYGSQSHVYKVNRFNQLEGLQLDHLNIFLDFPTNTRVKDVVNKITNYFMNQEDTILTELMYFFNADNHAQLIINFRTMLVEGIRALLMFGYFEYSNKIN